MSDIAVPEAVLALRERQRRYRVQRIEQAAGVMLAHIVAEFGFNDDPPTDTELKLACDCAERLVDYINIRYKVES